MSVSGKNHAESSINFVKIQFWDPKHAKLNQNSDFRHVLVFSWLNKLRNTQMKIHGTYLGIPYIFHIYFLDMFHCHPCIFPCVFLNLWSQERVRRWRKSEFWSNLARFGSRNGILTKWHNDSASFLPEKLKNQFILTKNLNI